MKKYALGLFILSILYYSVAQADPPPVVDLNSPADVKTSNLNNLSTEQRLVRIENLLSNQSQLVAQLNSLQQQVQELRGQVDLLSNQNQQLKQQQLKFYSDLDQRFQGFISEKSKSPVSDTQTANPVHANLPVAAATESEAYRNAWLSLQNKHYPLAIQQFQAFLKRYPNSDSVPSAHYWLGELHRIQNQSDLAKEEFNFLVKQYPQNPRVSDALLKLALIEYETGDKSKAIAGLKAVQKYYPGTPASNLAKAKLQSLK